MNEQSKHKVRNRKTIDMEQKMTIIGQFESGQKLTHIAKEHGLAHSTVKTILKDRERIKSHVSTTTSLKSTIITKKRVGAISETEKLLTTWIEEQMAGNVPLSLVAIQAKARSLFEEQKLRLGDTGAKFAASNGWFHRFKTRAGIANIKFGNDVQEQAKSAESYPAVFKNVIEEDDYAIHQVYNVGQTELFWNIPADHQTTSPEDRVTLLVGSNASGDHKLKPFLLVHSDQSPCLLQTEDPLFYCRFFSQAQMTAELFEDWFLNCFVPDVEQYCAEKNIPLKILLVLSDSLFYLTHLNHFRPDFRVLFLPPHSANVLEPANQGVVSTFRRLYLRQMLERAALKFQNSGEALSLPFPISDGVENVVKAWGLVDKAYLNAAWSKLCPQFVVNVDSNAIDVEAYRKRLSRDISAFSEILGWEIRGSDIDKFFVAPNKYETLKNTGRDVDDWTLFDRTELTTAFREMDSAMARFQKMDLDPSRFARVKNAVEKSLRCYRKFLEETRGEPSSSVLLDYASEVEDSPAYSQENHGQDALIVSVHPDDLMLISRSPECSD